MITIAIVFVALLFLGIAEHDKHPASKTVLALISSAFFAFAFAHHLGVTP